MKKRATESGEAPTGAKPLRIRIPVRVEFRNGMASEVYVEELARPGLATDWIAPSVNELQASMLAAAILEMEAVGLIPPSQLALDVKTPDDERRESLAQLTLFPNDYPRERPFVCLYCRVQTSWLAKRCLHCGWRGGGIYPNREIRYRFWLNAWRSK